MRMRSALMVAVYEKQLKLSNIGRKRHSTGEVMNYIEVDAYRMGEFPLWFHVSWSSFIQLILAIGVLFSIVGIGVLPGLAPIIICGLLNLPFAKAIQKCQLEFMMAQDKRLRSTSEILNNMKVIKLQSWEEKFKKVVESCRDVEFHWLREAQFKRSMARCGCFWIDWLCQPKILDSKWDAPVNILYGKPMNRIICALDKDIEAFKHGDLT
ncbi:ABC transporter C family member 8-like protein [Tanacetum coccineum]